MTSPIDEGGGSPRFCMPLTIKSDTMMNAHQQSQHIWSLTQDIDKVRKSRAEFNVDNWDEQKSKMNSLMAFATVSWKDNLLWKRQVASLEKYSHNEQEVKRQSLSVAPRLCLLLGCLDLAWVYSDPESISI